MTKPIVPPKRETKKRKDVKPQHEEMVPDDEAFKAFQKIKRKYAQLFRNLAKR